MRPIAAGSFLRLPFGVPANGGFRVAYRASTRVITSDPGTGTSTTEESVGKA